jgi:ribosomal protein S19
MVRSKWKPEFDVIKVNRLENIYNSSARITEDFLDRRVYIYNGRNFFTIIMREYMLGHCFGQYFRTKRLGDFHPTKVKRRKGKKPKGIKGKKGQNFKRSKIPYTRKKRRKGKKRR